MVELETKLDSLRTFSHLLDDYEKVISPCWPRGKGGVVVLYCKSLALQVSTIFVNPEGRLAVLEVTYSSKCFRLVSIYTTQKGPIQNNFYKCLEAFLVTSKTSGVR